MTSQNSDFTRKLRAAVRAKIEEYGIDVDDELPDYVMIMVGNKKDKSRMRSDLKLFLGDNTHNFVEWLFGFFQKFKTSSSTISNTTSLSTTTSVAVNKVDATTIVEKAEVKNKNTRDKSADSSEKHASRKEETTLCNLRKSKSSSTRTKAAKQHDDNEKARHQHKDGQEKRQMQTTSQTTTTTTTFAVPRPLLRSVIVNPPRVQHAHPRIRAQSRSPSPGNDVDDEQFVPSSSVLNMLSTATREVEGRQAEGVVNPARRVCFQRTFNQQQISPKPAELSVKGKKQQFEEEEDQQVKSTDHDQEEKKNLPMLVIKREVVQSFDDKEEAVKKPQLPQQQQRCKLVPLGRRTRAAPPLVGIGAIFQRAIQETQKQKEVVVGRDDPSRGGGTMMMRGTKRVSGGETETASRSEQHADEEEVRNGKRIRIELEEEKESARPVGGGQPGAGDEPCEDVEEEVLLVNCEKAANRSIRKEVKKPKSSLALLMEHIGGGADRKMDNAAAGGGAAGNDRKTSIKADSQTQKIAKPEQPSTLREVNLMEKPTRTTSNAAAATTTAVWDGRIEIDDDNMSSGDEAEIDAVLEEQDKLRKMALERETQLKGRELPPTAAMSRPLLYQGMATGTDPIPMLSPGEIDLLPASFYQNMPMITRQQSANQQHPTALPQTQQPILASSSTASRPYATVAPCLTTPSVTPTTLIMHQQQCHYHHTHQQQQNTIIVPQQFAHPYSTQHVQARISSHMSTMPNMIRANQPMAMGYSNRMLQQSQGSFFSKTYPTRQANNPSGVFAAAGGIGNSVGKAHPTPSPVINKLREQHRQMTQQYSNLLEEQRLLLANIQKMSSNGNGAEQRKKLLFKCKQMDKNANQVKARLEELNGQIMAAGKGGGSQQVVGINDIDELKMLQIKRFF